MKKRRRQFFAPYKTLFHNVVFAQRLKYLRKLRKLTQEQLAEMVDVDSRHISYIETVRSFPSSELIERICKALCVSYAQLFAFESGYTREELILNLNKIMAGLSERELLYLYKMSMELRL